MTVNSKLSGGGNYRWRICALLFFATAINYIDRQVLGILAPGLQKEFGWSESQYGLIVTIFQIAYATGFLFMGQLMDRIGNRIGYALAISVWSFYAMIHAVCRSFFSFGMARFGLGIGEAGNFPAAVKAVGEWFPLKERSFATGIFLSGSSIGAIVAPIMVPYIAIRYGWQWAFVVTGLMGFIWLVFWLTTYHPPAGHPKLSSAELRYIRQDAAPVIRRYPWLRLFRYRQTWAFAIGKFLTDPVFSFFFFFLPKFFYAKFGLTLDKIGPPLVMIYLMSDLGSIAGGWFSGMLIRKGWTVAKARRVTMICAGLLVPPVYFATQTGSLPLAVALIGLAIAGHQAWSANILTLPSDMFPQKAVGSVVGIGSTLGAVGGMIGATVAGQTLQYSGNYVPLFIAAGAAYCIAWIFIQLLAPRLKQVNLSN
jgi:MFS transporter, ACS family, hexuronate transporter